MKFREIYGAAFFKNVASMLLLIVITAHFKTFALQDTTAVTGITWPQSTDSLKKTITKTSKSPDTSGGKAIRRTDTKKQYNPVIHPKKNLPLKEDTIIAEKPEIVIPPTIDTIQVPVMKKIIIGSAIFAVSYGLALYTGSYYAIPCIGPAVGVFVEPPSASLKIPVTLLCVGWTATQSIGLFVLIKGITGKRVQTISSGLPVMITPFATNDKVGVNLSFSFNRGKLQ